MITKIHMSKVPFTATTFAPVIMLADNSCMVMVPADSPFKLGRILERSLRQALLISRGDISIFVTKPISAALLGIAVAMILGPICMSLHRCLVLRRMVRA
jgi:TctA family transporter